MDRKQRRVPFHLCDWLFPSTNSRHWLSSTRNLHDLWVAHSVRLFDIHFRCADNLPYSPNTTMVLDICALCPLPMDGVLGVHHGMQQTRLPQPPNGSKNAGLWLRHKRGDVICAVVGHCAESLRSYGLPLHVQSIWARRAVQALRTNMVQWHFQIIPRDWRNGGVVHTLPRHSAIWIYTRQ